MTDAKVVAIQTDSSDLSNINELLKEHGIDAEGAVAIPIAIPINSLDDISVALKNIGINADTMSTAIKKELEPKEEEPEGEIEMLRKVVEELAESNANLKESLNNALEKLMNAKAVLGS
jgi:hypothetical protein